MSDHSVSLLSVLQGLMHADNLGDVHDQINRLCDVIGIPQPEGDFLKGWTEQDWANVGSAVDDD